MPRNKYMAGHTGGYKYKCPECGGNVFEELDLKAKTLKYWCIGRTEIVTAGIFHKRTERRQIAGCGWERSIDLNVSV